MTASFRFEHSWHLPAPADRVYAALADVDRYAEWWPQVRRVARVDAQSGRTWVRSFLPYTLELLMTREVEDARRGLLRAGIAGDLEGWSQWHVRPEEDGTTVAGFEQEVEVTASLLARSAPLAGPLLRANHTWMMRRGEAGLAAYLA